MEMFTQCSIKQLANIVCGLD